MAHDLKLFHAYTACTRVILTALETVGMPYEDKILDFRAGDNRKPDYLAISPRGKVPCLLVDGKPLTENAAVLHWLHKAWPEAALFPLAETAWEEAQQLSALLWVASGWHPSVRAVKVPFVLTKGDPAPVRERGGQIFSALLDQLDAELAERQWWFGDHWSIVDTYLWWAYITSEFGGFDLTPWSNVARHRADNEAMPQLQQALAREQAAQDALEASKP